MLMMFLLFRTRTAEEPALAPILASSSSFS